MILDESIIDLTDRRPWGRSDRRKSLSRGLIDESIESTLESCDLDRGDDMLLERVEPLLISDDRQTRL